jgi:hypothetical protein
VIADPNINQKKAPVFPNIKPLKAPGTTADPLRIKKIKKKMRVSPTPINEDASRDSDERNLILISRVLLFSCQNDYT